MGEAKRRGSLQDRQAQAQQAAEQMASSFGSFTQAMAGPVDAEKFSFLFDVFSRAAVGQIPGVDPTERKIEIEGHGTMSFTNNPLNRGLKAVTDELQSMGVINPNEKAPYVARLMEVQSVLTSDRFAKFMRPEKDGMVAVSESLVNALASARFISRPPTDDSKRELGYDLDDLYAKADTEFAVSDD